VFLVLHVLETSRASFGRAAFVDRPSAVFPAWLRGLLVLGAVGFHARLLFRVGGDARREARYPDAGVRRLQLASGIVVAAFLVVHLGHAFVPALSGGAAAVYERLRHDLALAPYVGIYVVGIAATCLHFAQGVEAAASDLSRRFGAGAVRSARALGLASAVALFLVAMNTLSHFAVGRSFFLPR
jgi:succinate dehydrogenase/fumarate reductase cytochrome b subunit